jgi:hypothetical protein
MVEAASLEVDDHVHLKLLGIEGVPGYNAPFAVHLEQVVDAFIVVEDGERVKASMTFGTSKLVALIHLVRPDRPRACCT